MSASSRVAASVTPEPSRSDGSSPRSVPSAGSGPPAPWTSTVRMLSDHSTATSIRMLPKFSSATAAPSTATTNVFSRNWGTYWRIPRRSVGLTPGTLAGRRRAHKPRRRGDILSSLATGTPRTPMTETVRVYATCDIGQAALDRLRERGYDVEVYPEVQPPPKALVLEKLRSGIDALDHDAARPDRRGGPRGRQGVGAQGRLPDRGRASTTSTGPPPTATRSPSPTPPTSSPTPPPSTPSSCWAPWRAGSTRPRCRSASGSGRPGTRTCRGSATR